MLIGNFTDLKTELKAIQNHFKSGLLSGADYLYLTAQILRALKDARYNTI